MDEVDVGISHKVKEFLTRKLDESKNKIAKLKHKRKITKGLYNGSIVLSIVISAVLVTLSALHISLCQSYC